MGAPISTINKWLKENELLPYLSLEENTLINKNEKNLSEREMCDIGWYVESLCALLWAGSIFDTLSPQTHVPDTLVNFVPNIQKGDSADEFIKSIKVRSYRQLYKMLDLYYRAHWYARDGNFCGEDTKDFDLGIIQSRRRALEWVFYSNDWDNVDLST